jgi:hypothetical protein
MLKILSTAIKIETNNPTIIPTINPNGTPLLNPNVKRPITQNIITDKNAIP